MDDLSGDVAPVGVTFKREGNDHRAGNRSPAIDDETMHVACPVFVHQSRRWAGLKASPPSPAQPAALTRFSRRATVDLAR